MTPSPPPVPTGDPTLDVALGGGLPGGSFVLLRGEEGAGASEFALGLLRAALRRQAGGRAVHLGALRPPERARREAALLFADGKPADAIEFLRFDPAGLAAATGEPCAVVIVESAAAVLRAAPALDAAALGAMLGDAASGSNALVALLCSEHSLSREALASLEEAADVVLWFRWRHGGTMSRRILQALKLRGLAPAIEGEEVPVFELSVQRGQGVAVSQVTNVV